MFGLSFLRLGELQFEALVPILLQCILPTNCGQINAAFHRNFDQRLAQEMQVSQGAVLIQNWSTRLSNCKFHMTLQQQRGHTLKF